MAALAGASILILWFLPNYRYALVLLVLLVPGVILSAAGRVTLSAMVARDRRRMLRRAAVAALLLSTLYVPFIAIGGVTGAALASTAIYAGQYVTLRRLWTSSG